MNNALTKAAKCTEKNLPAFCRIKNGFTFAPEIIIRQ